MWRSNDSAKFGGAQWPGSPAVLMHIRRRDIVHFGFHQRMALEVVLTHELLGWRARGIGPFQSKYHVVPLRQLLVRVSQLRGYRGSYALEFYLGHSEMPILCHVPYNPARWLRALLRIGVPVVDPWNLLDRPLHAFWHNNRVLMWFMKIGIVISGIVFMNDDAGWLSAIVLVLFIIYSLFIYLYFS